MDTPLIPQHKKMDRTDFFWLIYVLFFLIEPFTKHSLALWLKSLAVILLFVLLYVAYLRTAGVRPRVLLLAAMFALGIAVYTLNGGATCFMIYAAALLPFTITSPLRIVMSLCIGALLLGLEALLLHGSPYSCVPGMVLILAVGGSNIFFAQKQRADCKLRMQQEEIEALAAVAERERIARDLHDVLGHTLSVIVLKSELAGRLLDRELAPLPEIQSAALQRARAELGDVERTARTALAEVREAIGGYRAKGLAAEIEAAYHTLAAAGVTLTTHGQPSAARFTAAEETVLALALREAVTNIVRHAQASACQLHLESRNGGYRLRIEDNGSGDGLTDRRPALLREGNGLRGMRERVESLGGQLSLQRDAGTALLIELPVRRV